MMYVNEIPRRCQLQMLMPSENAIANAIGEVEQAGAHPLLTDAVVLLSQAQAKLADYFDAKLLNQDI